MAFKLTNLRPFGNNETSGVQPALFVYWNEAGDTVTTAGFFEKDCGVKSKDQVLVVDANGTTNAWHYATVASGVITLTAQAVQEEQEGEKD